MANNDYCLDRVAIYLLKQRAIGVDYIGRVARLTRTTVGMYGHLLAVLLDYMSPIDRDLVTKLATGQLDMANLDGDEVSDLLQWVC